MTRTELYQAIKQLGLQDVVKNTTGKNFTQVSNTELEAIVTKAKTKKAKKTCSKPSTKKCGTIKKDVSNPSTFSECLIAVVSIFVAKKFLTEREANEILEFLL
jgi:hypothetical protein